MRHKTGIAPWRLRNLVGNLFFQHPIAGCGPAPPRPERPGPFVFSPSRCPAQAGLSMPRRSVVGHLFFQHPIACRASSAGTSPPICFFGVRRAPRKTASPRPAGALWEICFFSTLSRAARVPPEHPRPFVFSTSTRPAQASLSTPRRSVVGNLFFQHPIACRASSAGTPRPFVFSTSTRPAQAGLAPARPICFFGGQTRAVTIPVACSVRSSLPTGARLPFA